MAVGSIRGRSADIPGSASASFGTAPALPNPPDFPSLGGSGQIRDLGGRFAGGIYSVWYGLPVLAALPQRLQSDMHDATEKALKQLQDDMVAYAQDNAPWEDITGDARAELHSPALVKDARGNYTVILAHGVSYGIYLETMNGGAFGIIPQTIEEFASQLPDRLAGEM